jgi:hypothetical protein
MTRMQNELHELFLEKISKAIRVLICNQER